MSPINQHNLRCFNESILHNRPRCLTWTTWNQMTLNRFPFRRNRQIGLLQHYFVIHVGIIRPIFQRFNRNENHSMFRVIRYGDKPYTKIRGIHASIKPGVSMDYSSPKEERIICRVENLQVCFEMVEPLSDLIAMALADVESDNVVNSVEIGNVLTRRRERTRMGRALGVRIRIRLGVISVNRIDCFYRVRPSSLLLSEAKLRKALSSLRPFRLREMRWAIRYYYYYRCCWLMVEYQRGSMSLIIPQVLCRFVYGREEGGVDRFRILVSEGDLFVCCIIIGMSGNNNG